MSSRLRRFAVPTAAFVLGAIAVPTAAYAATATFAATSTAAAITATSNTGKPVIDGLRTAGTGDAMVLRNRSASSGAMGVHGKTYATSGVHVGIWGTNSSPAIEDSNGWLNGAGVFGDSTSVQGVGVIGRATNIGGTGLLGQADDASGVGVMGTGWIAAEAYGDLLGLYATTYTGAAGDGSYSILADADVWFDGHLQTASHNIAGTCVGGNSCLFTVPFPAGVQPIVVVTPTSDPGGSFWVSNVSESGFKMNGPNTVTFNYVVVGFTPTTVGFGAQSTRPTPVRRPTNK